MIDALELAREQLEPWYKDHLAAMECGDLEDLLERHLRSGIRSYDAIRSLDDGWSRKVQAGTIQFSADIARQIRKLYEDWTQPCEEVMKRIRALELDFEIKGAGEFITAYRTVRAILRTPVQTLIDAMAEVNASKAA